MAYQTIMVYLDNESQAATLLQVATTLARRHSAHLMGVYVQPPLQVYVSAEVAAPVYRVEDHEAYHANLSGKLKILFEAAISTEEFLGEWRYIDSNVGSVADTVTEIARTVDLVVVGQKDEEEQDPSQRGVPEHLLMAAHRPVILVPRNCNCQDVGSRVFVAWDGGPTATRAVFDALPVLQHAESVKLHRINPTHRDRHKILGIPADMVRTLTRHEINVELAESDANSSDIGTEILSYAKEMGADLIVMGGYGHSRLREYLFGGVTRQVLDNLSLPVLMTH